jgi:hypothetical protein
MSPIRLCAGGCAAPLRTFGPATPSLAAIAAVVV